MAKIKPKLSKSKSSQWEIVEDVSAMGYRDDSPYRNRESIDINTPNGLIDMSETGMPILANGRYLPPYSGMHQFEPGVVKEERIMKDGGQYLTVDGEYHRVYRNAEGDIMVNHPKEDKGKWDTINLTDKSDANTIAEGVSSVKKWHKENPYAFGGNVILERYADGGELIKRADGSYSKRGLWDNIRENAGSGKKPTKEMLKQEKKIKASEKKAQNGMSITDKIQLGLDAAQFVPVVGEAAYIASLPFTTYDVGKNIYKGDWKQAGLDALGYIPAFKAFKYGVKGEKLLDTTSKLAKQLQKTNAIVNTANTANDTYKEKKANGGSIPIMQTGGRKPLEISDPREFKIREQAYNDSLQLFSDYEKEKNALASTGYSPLMSTPWSGGISSHATIKPSAEEAWGKNGITSTWINVYEKPVQPVTFVKNRPKENIEYLQSLPQSLLSENNTTLEFNENPYTKGSYYTTKTGSSYRNPETGVFEPKTFLIDKKTGKKLTEPKFQDGGQTSDWEIVEDFDEMPEYKHGGKTPAWQRKEGKSPTGGLNAKGRASLKREGHDIKPPQPQGGARKKSFCARMKGHKKKNTSAEVARDPNSRINLSLKKWKC